MTSGDLSHAIINAFLQGGEQFLEGTMAAALPLLWLLVVALHLARPYMVRTTRKFSLRLGADLWWVLYIGLRDLLMALLAVFSFMYFFPDVLLANALPIGGSLATTALFGALLVKLVADADDDPRAFKLVSALIGLGSFLYLVPTLLGVQLSNFPAGPAWASLGRGLTTDTNPGVAIALCWISIAVTALMGLAALWYDLASPENAKRALRVSRRRQARALR